MTEEGADTDIALSKPYKQLSHSGGQVKHLFFFIVHLKNLKYQNFYNTFHDW